jgi:hypothetical protein
MNLRWQRSPHGQGLRPQHATTPLKQPGAWLPIAMSLAALAVTGGSLAIFGAVRDADEGAAAHLWQLLMAMQVPVVAWFAVQWLRRAPKQALQVLALQALAAAVAVAPVWFFRL